MRVSITCTNEALRSGSIAIAAIWGDEGGEVAVSWVNRYAVIAMPTIHCAFNFTTWNGGDNCLGCFCVVSLPWCMFVQLCVVNNTAGRTISFGCDDHWVAPDYEIVPANLFFFLRCCLVDLVVSVKI